MVAISNTAETSCWSKLYHVKLYLKIVIQSVKPYRLFPDDTTIEKYTKYIFFHDGSIMFCQKNVCFIND